MGLPTVDRTSQLTSIAPPLISTHPPDANATATSQARPPRVEVVVENVGGFPRFTESPA
jgi:hypothetical protein